MRRAALLALLILAACGEPGANTAKIERAPTDAGAEAAPAPAPAAAPNLCAAEAHTNWVIEGDGSYAVSAYTAGPSCAAATATLVIHGAGGAQLLRFEAPTEHIFDLREATDSESMNFALAGWIEQRNQTMRTTAQLPEWRANQNEPTAGEFPFYPDEGVSRAAYNSIRAANKPMFCHTQGLESLACYALDRGALTKIGAQSFPG